VCVCVCVPVLVHSENYSVLLVRLHLFLTPPVRQMQNLKEFQEVTIGTYAARRGKTQCAGLDLCMPEPGAFRFRQTCARSILAVCVMRMNHKAELQTWA
jgi:hypothetical protein